MSSAIFWETETPDRQLWAETAAIKRYVDALRCDARFREHAMGNPLEAAAEIDLTLPEEEARYYARVPMPPVRGLLAAYIEEKVRYRQRIRERAGVLREERLAAWRLRQIQRCDLELGPTVNNYFTHLPFLIELSSGCSIGCPFCGRSAGRLKKTCRADEATMNLFSGLILGAEELLGAAVREAVLYYATEPTDCPDYLTFCRRFLALCGRVPITTTAAPLRNPEWTRTILTLDQSGDRTVQRVSVLSEETFRRCAKTFSPEETLFAEFMPRYTEGGGLVRAGRGAEMDEADGIWTNQGTISCVSGFIVNLAEHTVRLSAPCRASAEWPQGEQVLPLGSFSTAQEALDLIEASCQQMRVLPEENLPLRLQPFLRFSEADPGLLENPGILRLRPDAETAAFCRALSKESLKAEEASSRLNLPVWKAQLVLAGLFKRGLIRHEDGFEK